MLLQEVCKRDREGVVAKMANAPYDMDAPTWIKIKNRRYSQAGGRHDFFDAGRRRLLLRNLTV